MKFLKFYADWCGPCKVLTTNLDIAGIDYEAINIEENEELCSKYNIRNVPTFIAIKDDNEIARFVGIKTPQDIETWIDELNG